MTQLLSIPACKLQSYSHCLLVCSNSPKYPRFYSEEAALNEGGKGRGRRRWLVKGGRGKGGGKREKTNIPGVFKPVDWGTLKPRNNSH